MREVQKQQMDLGEVGIDIDLDLKRDTFPRLLGLRNISSNPAALFSLLEEHIESVGRPGMALWLEAGSWL